MLVRIRRVIKVIFMLALAACGDDSGHGVPLRLSVCPL